MDNHNMDEFWITIRYALVILGILGLMFILYKCSVESDAFTSSTPLNRCLSKCEGYSGADKSIICMAECNKIFGNTTIN